MSDNVYKSLYKSKNPTGGEIFAAIVLVFLLAFIMLGFSAWIVMLLLGALGAETGWFVGPSYFVTFLGVWLLKTVGSWFGRPNTKVN